MIEPFKTKRYLPSAGGLISSCGGCDAFQASCRGDRFERCSVDAKAQVLLAASLTDGKLAIRSSQQRTDRLLKTADALDDCYSSIGDDEFMTARDWWNNAKLPSHFPDIDGSRSHWMTQRQPFQPIVGDDTMIAGVVYTFDASMLKMNIFFPPLYPQENRKAVIYLLVADNVAGTFKWQGASTNCEIQEHTWYCPVRVASLDATRAYTYQIRYYPDPTNNTNLIYLYEGIIPLPQKYPRIAALSCFGSDDTKDKTALVQAVIETEPDLLLLQGDHTYMSDALGYGFLELMYTIRNITRSIPTLIQMDDHDYGEPNLWGAAFSNETSGMGFHQPVCLINALQELYMSHMPDPVTNKTLDNGIDTYYTNYRYGSVDFAILESRKFKSKEANGSLLGADQEAWLQDWCSDDASELRVILAQTPFAALGTHASRMRWPFGMMPASRSTDTNGFPVEARDRFMNIAKGCTPMVLSGDQHLGLAVTYDEYGISECTSPAVVNDVFWRINTGPLDESRLDDFGNQYRLLNVFNVDDFVVEKYTPSQTRYASLSLKAGRADGFLIVDLDGERATCAVHSYRQAHEPVWSVDVPAQVK